MPHIAFRNYFPEDLRDEYDSLSSKAKLSLQMWIKKINGGEMPSPEDVKEFNGGLVFKGTDKADHIFVTFGEGNKVNLVVNDLDLAYLEKPQIKGIGEGEASYKFGDDAKDILGVKFGKAGLLKGSKHFVQIDASDGSASETTNITELLSASAEVSTKELGADATGIDFSVGWNKYFPPTAKMTYADDFNSLKVYQNQVGAEGSAGIGWGMEIDLDNPKFKAGWGPKLGAGAKYKYKEIGDSNDPGGLNLNEEDYLELREEGLTSLLSELERQQGNVRFYWPPPEGSNIHQEIKDNYEERISKTKAELEETSERLGEYERERTISEGDQAIEELQGIGIDLYGENEPENHVEIDIGNIQAQISLLKAAIQNI